MRTYFSLRNWFEYVKSYLPDSKILVHSVTLTLCRTGYWHYLYTETYGWGRVGWYGEPSGGRYYRLTELDDPGSIATLPEGVKIIITSSRLSWHRMMVLAELLNHYRDVTELVVDPELIHLVQGSVLSPNQGFYGRMGYPAVW